MSSQFPADALFALKQIEMQRPEARRLEGCELCQHCTLLRALFRARNAEQQDHPAQIEGEKHHVEQR